MPLSLADRVKQASATTGTGTLTLGAAVSGYRRFEDYADGVYPYVIEDGVAWEVGWGTLFKASNTFARTRVEVSTNANSAINCTGAEYIYCDWVGFLAQGLSNAAQTYISGLLVTKTVAANTIDISAGYCFDPSSNKIITYAGATGISVGTLGASQWNQVYLYDVAGTATVEVVNNAAPPSTAYAGTARQGGTNSNRRWIGSFLTTAASNIVPVDVKESGAGQIEVTYLATTNASPYRCLSAGTQTSYTAVSLVGAIPRYVAVEFHPVLTWNYATTGNETLTVNLSINGTDLSDTVQQYCQTTNLHTLSMWLLMERATPQIYYKVAALGAGNGPRLYIDVDAYRAVR